jgi:histidinol phosphatase-like PHP family hydrolase
MKITSDWHIHSRNSCDQAALAVSDLIAEAARAGILDFGLTDHIHTFHNLPDLHRSRAEFLASRPSAHFHFGVEVSCVSAWEIEEIARGGHENPVYGLRSGGAPGCALAIGLSEDDIAACGVEYVVGGTHWPLYVPMEREAVIRDYHRQNMFLAVHPLVDIVAHPWWWMGHWKGADGKYSAEPWFDDFGVIPRSMHDEFAAAAIENGKVVEINISAMLLNPGYPERFVLQYLDYVAWLKAEGVSLCVGSDCHGEHYQIDFEAAGRMLESVGIEDADLWRLPPRGTAWGGRGPLEGAASAR